VDTRAYPIRSSFMLAISSAYVIDTTIEPSRARLELGSWRRRQGMGRVTGKHDAPGWESRHDNGTDKSVNVTESAFSTT
jgi:hypothetical protein